MFVTPSALRKRVRRELIEAQNELMNSQANMELVKANPAMLLKRVHRLTLLNRNFDAGKPVETRVN